MPDYCFCLTMCELNLCWSLFSVSPYVLLSFLSLTICIVDIHVYVVQVFLYAHHVYDQNACVVHGMSGKYKLFPVQY
jgi:hypothetical protein